jgi:hypothetical protein
MKSDVLLHGINLIINNMKNKYVFIGLLILLFFSKIASSQTTFQKLYGGTSIDYGYTVNLTSDGGYILSGVTSSFGAGNGDVYLIKTDANGDTLWSRTYGGTNADEGHSVQQTVDGGYIIAGYTSSFGSRAYVIKTDANGNTLWTKTYGGSVVDFIVSVQQTSDNGFILAGYTMSFGAGSFDVYLIKTDANGNISWTKTYGGINNDYASAVRQTSDGGYIIAGYSNSFGTNANYDVYLIKTDGNGNPAWSKIYGGSGQDRGYDVRQTTDGGYIVAGYTDSFGSGGNDVYLVKTDAGGSLVWSETFGGAGNDFGYAVEQTSDHGYIVAGNTTGFGLAFPDVYLIKTDSTGIVTMSKTYGGGADDEAYSVRQTSDGGYLVGGYSNSFTVSYMTYLIKTDAHLTTGCYEANPFSSRSLSATQVTTAATMVSSGGTAVTPSTLAGSGVSSETLCVTVGVNELTPGRSLSVYPNPFSDELSVKGTSANGTIIMMDITGREIIQQKANDAETKINTEKVQPGLYLMKYTEGKNTSTYKVTKF